MKNSSKGFLKAFSNFSVSKHAKLYGTVPFAILIIAIIVVIALGATGGSYSDAVGIGIDFEGGTILTVELGRDAIDNYAEHSEKIKNAIEKHGVVVSYIQQQQANSIERSSIAFRYKNISNDDAQINELNEKIRDDVDNLYSDRPGNVTFESIGATAASDLLSKAGIALAVSIVLILIYIMIRFTPVSALAAIIALLHDVVIMFCLTVICRIQINSSYVAAMITIIAYSINNTIIIFDRCREEVKPLKGQKNIPYAQIGDRAVRETMTRSIYTTFTTMVTVIFLAILGSESIREFCVPIILGLLAGMYSSVLLATPLWSTLSVAYDKFREKHAKGTAVVYDKDGEEQTVSKPAKSDDDNAEAQPKQVRQAGAKPKNNNTVYKYSKKNTTFKKKK